jgi:flagellar FliJ protein
MSQRVKRLQSIAELAKKDEDQALQLLAASQQEYTQAQQQWEQLSQFLKEYQGRFVEWGAEGAVSVARIQDYQAFMGRLNEAMVVQQHVVDQTEQDVQQKRQEWLAKRVNTQALEKVVSRYQDEEKRQENSKEQRDNDEYASRSYHQKRHQ